MRPAELLASDGVLAATIALTRCRTRRQRRGPRVIDPGPQVGAEIAIYLEGGDGSSPATRKASLGA